MLHELGHFLAGRLQGMRLLNLSVGPFVIERYEGKLHFHIVPSVLGYLGRAMMGFPEHLNKEAMKKKLIRYIYGGPLINIFIGIIDDWNRFRFMASPVLPLFRNFKLVPRHYKFEPRHGQKCDDGWIGHSKAPDSSGRRFRHCDRLFGIGGRHENGGCEKVGC